jgi:hypothetical protein
MSEFIAFRKMPRLSREIIITEKIDGTNAQLYITEERELFIGSRTRWITPENDNHGFAKWATEHKEEIMTLPSGRYFGEWWGNGIQRGYGLPRGDKRLSLFNTSLENLPACIGLVPVLYQGVFNQEHIDWALYELKRSGSRAVAGFMNPEGIVIYHVAGQIGFKKTIENDDVPKSKV